MEKIEFTVQDILAFLGYSSRINTQINQQTNNLHEEQFILQYLLQSALEDSQVFWLGH
jgi:hypothetical protein